MAAPRTPPTTDPLMVRSLRDDFPAPMEREIIDGGVREGRPETTRFPGLVWLVVMLLGGLIALLVFLWWRTPWFR